MDEFILCVDDDPNILAAFKRYFRKTFNIHTAEGPEEGLQAIRDNNTYAVIVSDYRMPVMDGIRFLTRAKEMSPNSVRMMLTGNADLAVASEAVNEGSIFRFITKPCPPDRMADLFNDGLEQFRLIRAEKDLLENTLRGGIKVLTEVLSLVKPTAFGRASRVSRMVVQLAGQLKAEPLWQYELAARLSQLGCVVLPDSILDKVYIGQPLTPAETELFEQHPRTAADLIGRIPRMEEVAEIIRHQETRFDSGEGILLGSRILKVALDYDSLLSSGLGEQEALAKIVLRGESWYDPAVVFALKNALQIDVAYEALQVTVQELAPNMILAEDVKGKSGILLFAKGQEIMPSLCTRLKSLAASAGVREPIKVLVPMNFGPKE